MRPRLDGGDDTPVTLHFLGHFAGNFAVSLDRGIGHSQSRQNALATVAGAGQNASKQ
jgi:hypothetical protein